MYRQTRIVIFVKAPIPGFCKTRLIDVLGAEGAAALARKMLSRTVSIAKEANIGPVELCVTPDPDHPCLRLLDLSAEVVWSRQAEGDLGARMAAAVERTLGVGENVLCIGTDCLELEVRGAEGLDDRHCVGESGRGGEGHELGRGRSNRGHLGRRLGCRSIGRFGGLGVPASGGNDHRLEDRHALFCVALDERGHCAQ